MLWALAVAFWLAPRGAMARSAAALWVDQYSVMFDSPPNMTALVPDSWASMPIGNGDTTANVWLDAAAVPPGGQGGDVLMYVGKGDAYSEMHQLMKVGRLRLATTDAPVAAPFTAVLHPSNATLEMRLGNATGGGDSSGTGHQRVVTAWIDAHANVLRLRVEQAVPFNATLAVDTYRTQAVSVPRDDLGDLCGTCLNRQPGGTPTNATRVPDVATAADGGDVDVGGVGWYHRNAPNATAAYLTHGSLWEAELRLQGLWEGCFENAAEAGGGSSSGADTNAGKCAGDPLTNRTFGGVVGVTVGQELDRNPVQVTVGAAQVVARGAGVDAAVPTFRIDFAVAIVTAQTPTEGGYRDALRAALGAVRSYDDALAAHTAWWEAFWGRSRVVMSGAGAAFRSSVATVQGGANMTATESARVSQQLALQRYTAAAQQRGSVGSDVRSALGPGIQKFNGGIFSVDPSPNDFADDDDTPSAREVGVHMAPRGSAKGGRVGGDGRAHRLGRTVPKATAAAAAAAAPSNNLPLYIRDADFRDWGGAFWFQNTRHSYWPAFSAGDAELLLPLFEMYRRALPLAALRTRLYFGHDGVFFPETMWMFGTFVGDNYGCDRSPAGPTPWLAGPAQIDNRYIARHLESGLELCALLLDYYDYQWGMGNGTDGGGVVPAAAAFANETLVPIVRGVLRFNLEHYDMWQGRMVVTPAQALETYQEATNPVDIVAGLQWVTRRVLELPEAVSGQGGVTGLLQTAQQLEPVLPVLPLGNRTGANNFRPVCDAATSDGNEALPLSVLPAESFGRTNNQENPELYAVHPFRLLGVNRTFNATAAYFEAAHNSHLVHGGVWWPPNVSSAEELGRVTYERRRFVSAIGEWQDVLQAANLGLGEEALAMVRGRFALGAVEPVDTPDPASAVIFAEGAWNHAMRFPAFFGLVRDDHNSFPDDEHPALARNAMQNMLLQADGRRLLLFPAWGVGWPDVDFKLSAPMNTTVEARCVGGKLQGLVVTPASRAQDIVQLGCGMLEA